MAIGEQLSLDFEPASTGDLSLAADLPEGWKLCRLGELVTVTGGGTPSKSHAAYWDGAIPWVTPKDMKVFDLFDSQDHISAAAVTESSAKTISPGSVLVVFRSGILAHTLPIAINRVSVTLNQDLKALAPCSDITSEYLAFYLRSVQKQVLSDCQKQGATVQSIDTERFLRTLVPLPPLSEQRRIVCLLYTSPSPRDRQKSRMPSSA